MDEVSWLKLFFPYMFSTIMTITFSFVFKFYFQKSRKFKLYIVVFFFFVCTRIRFCVKGFLESLTARVVFCRKLDVVGNF